MNTTKILVVDDEQTIVNTVRSYLEREGYNVRTAVDGLTALEIARTFQPDLIVLDIMLPGMDGLELLNTLRRESEVYVLLLSAKTEEMDRIVGLTMGADDYLTKPFSPHELVARVKAILRRDRGVQRSQNEPALDFGQLRLDIEGRRVWKSGIEIELTPIEFDLLITLARHPGFVLSREQLIEQVWNYDYFGDERVVDAHIGRLRKKIENDPAQPTLIVTVRGAGYRFEGESEQS
jgi:two-component system alkaline phosphatase synthesis response regulator PhoP